MKTLIEFLIYLHVKYIVEEWEILTPIGQKILKPFWFIRSIFVYLMSPIIFIGYLIEKTEWYKSIQKDINDIDNIIKNLN